MTARGLVAGVVLGCAVAIQVTPARADAPGGSVQAPAAADGPGRSLPAAVAAEARSSDERLAQARAALSAHASRESVAGAVEALSGLTEETLPAIERRATVLARFAPTADLGAAALSRFTEAARATSGATGEVDARDGIAPVLSASPTRADVVTAERLCLLRSLERIGTPHALVVAYQIFSVDITALRSEARRLVAHAGRPMTAALLLAGSHPSKEVGRLATVGLESLAITDPTSALEEQSPESIAEILLAYATIGHMGAMSVVVAAIGDPRAVVREAAREATRRYGENATWQLRLALENRLSTTPRQGAGHRELFRELCAGLDARREAPIRDAIDRAVKAAADGDFAAAAHVADELLIAHPDAPARERLAPVYVALAEAAKSRSAHDEASALYRRALVLAPGDPEAPAWNEHATAEAQGALVARGAPVDDVEARIAEPDAPRTSLRTRLGRFLGVLGVFLLAGPVAWSVARRLPLAEWLAIAGARVRQGVERLAPSATPSPTEASEDVPNTGLPEAPTELAVARLTRRARTLARALIDRTLVAARDARAALPALDDVRVALDARAARDVDTPAIEASARAVEPLAPRVIDARVHRTPPHQAEVPETAASNAVRSADARGRAELAALVRGLSHSESGRASHPPESEAAQPAPAPKRRPRPTRKAALPVELVLGNAKPPRRHVSKP